MSTVSSCEWERQNTSVPLIYARVRKTLIFLQVFRLLLNRPESPKASPANQKILITQQEEVKKICEKGTEILFLLFIALTKLIEMGPCNV